SQRSDRRRFRLPWRLILSLASGEDGCALLEERVAPFERVRAQADFRLRLDLAAELVGVARVLALIDQVARRDQRPRRAIGELARQLKRTGGKRAVIKHLAEQSPFFRLLSPH